MNLVGLVSVYVPFLSWLVLFLVGLGWSWFVLVLDSWLVLVGVGWSWSWLVLVDLGWSWSWWVLEVITLLVWDQAVITLLH